MLTPERADGSSLLQGFQGFIRGWLELLRCVRQEGEEQGRGWMSRVWGRDLLLQPTPVGSEIVSLKYWIDLRRRMLLWGPWGSPGLRSLRFPAASLLLFLKAPVVSSAPDNPWLPPAAPASADLPFLGRGRAPRGHTAPAGPCAGYRNQVRAVPGEGDPRHREPLVPKCGFSPGLWDSRRQIPVQSRHLRIAGAAPGLRSRACPAPSPALEPFQPFPAGCSKCIPDDER